MWLPVIDTAHQSGLGGIWSHDLQGRRAILPAVYAALDGGGRLVIEARRIPHPIHRDAWVPGPAALYVRCGDWRLGRIPDSAAIDLMHCIRRLALEHLPCRLRPDSVGDMGKWFEAGIEVQIIGGQK
jgi:hypothetical protein